MDPLTHTLVGANLASTPLANRTRFATAACVIGANLPDVDAILYATGHQDLALHFRRGWTHGVLAMFVLPFLLTGALLLFDRQRTANRRSLLLLSFIAMWTHPALDWLNNYGMRWLMPFRSTWSYGDSVYIMDPWLWMILGIGYLLGRRPTLALSALFVVIALWLGSIVYRRSPEYLGIVAIVGIALFASMFLERPQRAAVIALTVAAIYIGSRLVIHELTERRVRRELGTDRVMAAPHPIDPTRWDVVAQVGDHYRYGRFTWTDRTLRLADDRLPVAKDSPEWRVAKSDPAVRGFMNWARFPWYEVEGRRIHVHDARYAVRRRARGGWGGVSIELR
jgi:inner membrane protein